MASRHLPRYAFLVPLAASFAIGAEKPDFTGRWELIVEKSSFGTATKPVRMTVESTMQGAAMRSTQTTYTGQESQTTEFTWYLDGKRHPTEKPAPGYSVTHWEDSTLITERASDDGAYKEIAHLSLSRDRKVATEVIQTTTPNGNNKEKLVWRKVP